MVTIAQMKAKVDQERKVISRLIELEKQGNIAKVVSGNPCPRKSQCMVELCARQMYSGFRNMTVPAGRNPFKD